MARITLTLWDKHDGRVGIEMDPPWPTLYKIAKAGRTTPAEAYAFSAMVKLQKDSKAMGNQLRDDKHPRFDAL